MTWGRSLLFSLVISLIGLSATGPACGPSRSSRVPVASAALDPMTQAIEAGEFRRIEAVLVEQGGQVLYEGYFGKTGPQTRVDARSAGKSITALAVGVAIDDGLLEGVDSAVFPNFSDRAPFAHDGPPKQAIRVEDLLTMSSALDCDDWEPSPGNEERMYRTRDWTRFALDIPLEPGYRRGPNGRGRYSYCTAGAFLLGRLVERAAGQPFDRYVESRLFEPLGIEGAQWTRAPNGEVQSGGQLSLRARDFAAVGRLILDGGKHRGKVLVSVGWLEQMLQPRLRATPRDAYGYLWWIRDFFHGSVPNPGFYMSGNGGNKTVLFPELDAVVVVLSTNYNERDMHDLSTAIVEHHVLPVLRPKDGS